MDSPEPPVSPAGINCLRTIYNLMEDSVPLRRIRVAQRLGVAGSTISETVARLQEHGLLTTTPDNLIELTPAGHRIAASVVRRHRLAERMLTDILGVPVSRVHSEAIRWEQVINDDTERAISNLVDGSVKSPWGNPIPSADDGAENRVVPVHTGTSLTELVAGRAPTDVIVESTSEEAQNDPDTVRALVNAGIVPGSRITAVARRSHYLLRGTHAYELPTDSAHLVHVVRM
ncbi:Fur family transcriptional regulator [Gordonia sp. i37]|nr:Fur family transcriptional regulator [Gordonia sp. i37]